MVFEKEDVTIIIERCFMKKVIKIILIVIASIVLLGAIFGTVDYIRAKNGKKPMFAYRNVNVNDEGYFVATEYYGLGYAIVICNKYCDKNVTLCLFI